MTDQPDKRLLEFSLVQGGPLYHLFRRGRLLRPPTHLMGRRILAVLAVAWLPLLVLTLLARTAVGGVAAPFLFDLDAQARFLIAMPLLLLAEIPVHRRLRSIVEQFIKRGIIGDGERKRFKSIIDSVLRARNSVIAELTILALAAASHWLWVNTLTLHVDTWYAAFSSGGTLTTAGWWYATVSLVVFRFLLYRWVYRFILWYWFLWRVSRLKLHLNPLHPDRAGGLGFLAGSAHAVAPVLAATTVLLSGLIGNRIWHDGATLPQFKLECVGAVVLLLMLAVAPLFFFLPKMTRAKRQGLHDLGPFSTRYVEDFRRRWLSRPAPEASGPSDQPLPGTIDIQSLAALAGSFAVVQDMRVIPFSRRALLHLAIMIALPLAPLLLTVIPVEQVVDKLFEAVFG